MLNINYTKKITIQKGRLISKPITNMIKNLIILRYKRPWSSHSHTGTRWRASVFGPQEQEGKTEAHPHLPEGVRERGCQS